MELKTIDIQGKPYVTVAARIRYFHENNKNGGIFTRLLSPIDSKLIVFEAVVVPDMAKPDRKFNGHSQAVVGDGYINKTAAMENCETSAVGRALGMMGIGIDAGLASADEVVKAQNSPVQSDKAPDVMSDDFVSKLASNTPFQGCRDCGGPMSAKPSAKSGKHYCARLCFKDENKHLQDSYRAEKHMDKMEDQAMKYGEPREQAPMPDSEIPF